MSIFRKHGPELLVDLADMISLAAQEILGVNTVQAEILAQDVAIKISQTWEASLSTCHKERK